MDHQIQPLHLILILIHKLNAEMTVYHLLAVFFEKNPDTPFCRRSRTDLKPVTSAGRYLASAGAAGGMPRPTGCHLSITHRCAQHSATHDQGANAASCYSHIC